MKLALTSALFFAALSNFAAPAGLAASSLKGNLPPEQALQALKDGNQRFVTDKTRACNNASASRTRLRTSQAPNAIILSCSDSRVPPEQIFDEGLGQLFVVRVAGNVLNRDAIASIEYAVSQLGSRLIVILGHESCGAIKAAIQSPPGKSAGSKNIDHLLAQIRANLGSMTSSPDPELRQPAMKNVDAVAANLLSRSKIISDAVKSGQVKIEQGIYDLGSGRVDFWSSSGKS